MLNSTIINTEKMNIKTSTIENTRITYVDTAKAIAIFLVILSHTLPSTHKINQYIFSFHVPLFFFISGWINKNKILHGRNEWKKFVFKKIYTLLVPYFFIFFNIYKWK